VLIESASRIYGTAVGENFVLSNVSEVRVVFSASASISEFGVESCSGTWKKERFARYVSLVCNRLAREFMKRDESFIRINTSVCNRLAMEINDATLRVSPVLMSLR
jgi:hypothetical protein